MDEENPFAVGSGAAAPVAATTTEAASFNATNTFEGAPVRARHRVKMDGFGAGVLGVADTVTFGYLDELGAGADWLFLGKDYEQALQDNRDIFAQAEEEHGGSLLAGQIVGGFVPLAGWGGRIKKANDARIAMTGLQATRSMMMAGAVQGAIYGSGSADGDLYDRLKGAAVGGLWGGAGGLLLGGAVQAGGFAVNKTAALFRFGKPQKLLDNFAPGVFERHADEAVEAGLKTAKREAGPIPGTRATRSVETGTAKATTKNVITGQADDVLEEGALLTTKELTGDVSVARKALAQRIGKMTTDDAVRMAQRLEKMEADGSTINDPHYRSLLGIDIEGTGVDTDTALRAAELLEEATDAILEKAGLGRKTSDQIEREFQKKFAGALTEAELNKAVDGMSDAVMHTRVADHVAMLASVQLSKARSVLLPEMQKGVEGARERLAESITHAVSLMARANYVKSQAGRALNSLRQQGKLAFDEVVEGVDHLQDVKAIRARIDETLKVLGDSELAEMLARLRNPKDVDTVIKTLMNTEDAKTVGNFLRVKRTMSAFIKSNLLTPASGIFNTVGFVLHDLFRNHLARQWAANAYQMAGKDAEAMAMRFEHEVANAVYWKAHAHGLKAMVDRIKWDHWQTVEKRGILLGKDTSKVAQKKLDLLASGFKPAEVREFDLQARATVTNPREFNNRMKELEAAGGFSAVWAAAQRAGAATLHQLDAAGTATAKVVSGALDSWGSNMVTLKETYAQAARYAWREAASLGLPPDQLPKYAQRRAQELAEMPPAELLREVEQKLIAREEVDDALKFAMGVRGKAEKEAQTVLFMDGPQTSGGKLTAGFMDKVDTVAGLGLVKGLLTPYVSTPTRILETGLVKYTPWGHKADEVRKILERGGADAALEVARMEMGSMAIGVGMMLGVTGAVTVTNGGWDNASQLDEAPANRLNLPGGGFVEFGRLDPFAFTISLGATIGQAMQAYREADQMGLEAQEAVEASMAIAYYGIREAVLEKSYLTGLRDAAQALFSNNESDPTAAASQFVEKKLGTLVTTQIPFSGTMRQVADTIRGQAPEATSILDQLLRLVPVPDILPAKVDFLGEEVDGRVLGIQVGDKKTGEGDWLRDELAKSGIRLSDIERRDRSGFDLTGSELSELRRIRATEATNSYGQTMREALEELVTSDEFRNAPTKKAKQEMFKDALDGLSKSAQETMEERNPGYQSKRRAYKSLAAYIAEGMHRDDAKAQATADVLSEGLPDPEL